MNKDSTINVARDFSNFEKNPDGKYCLMLHVATGMLTPNRSPQTVTVF